MPAEHVKRERAVVSVDVKCREDVSHNLIVGQTHQTISEAKLGEDEENLRHNS